MYVHTGIGILDSSLPIQFFMMLHKLSGWLGLSGTRVRRSLFGSVVDKAEDAEVGWELAEVRCRPLLPCRDSKFDFDCNEQRMLTFTIYIIFNIQTKYIGWQ
jgi:hypothetical protein